MPMTDAAKNAILNFIYRNTPSGIGTLYVSLHTADPGTSGANESGLGRQLLAAAAPSGGATSNAGIIRWNGPAPGATSYSHFGLWDAASGGNFEMGKALTSTITTGSGGPVEIPIGGLALTVDLV